MREALDVIVAATAHSTNPHAHAIVRAEDLSTKCERRRTHGGRCLQKVTSINCHGFPYLFLRGELVLLE